MTEDWPSYAAGIREGAHAVAEGCSQYVDGRRLCVDCGCPARELEDMRCPGCNREPLEAKG